MDNLVAIIYVKSEAFKFNAFYYLPTNTFLRLPKVNSRRLLAKQQLLFYDVLINSMREFTHFSLNN